MPTNLETSAVDTGMEKVSFYSNSKERKCQKMLKSYKNDIIFQQVIISWQTKDISVLRMG